MQGVVGHGQEPEKKVGGYGDHQPTPGRRHRTCTMFGDGSQPVCPSPLAGPCTDFSTHGVFVPVLPEACGVRLCINTPEHIPTCHLQRSRVGGVW